MKILYRPVKCIQHRATPQGGFSKVKTTHLKNQCNSKSCSHAAIYLQAGGGHLFQQVTECQFSRHGPKSKVKLLCVALIMQPGRCNYSVSHPGVFLSCITRTLPVRHNDVASKSAPVSQVPTYFNANKLASIRLQRVSD